LAKISGHTRGINDGTVVTRGTRGLGLNRCRHTSIEATVVLHAAARNDVLNRNRAPYRPPRIAISDGIGYRRVIRGGIIEDNSAQRRFSNRIGGGSQCRRGCGNGHTTSPEQSAGAIGSAGIAIVVIGPEIQLGACDRIENGLGPGFRGVNNCRRVGKVG